MSKTYFEKLKDPRWQKKRLEVMEREKFKCEYCECDDKTLNIHHGYYEKGVEPWEYETNTLHCLCENCHEHAWTQTKVIHKIIASFNIIDLDYFEVVAEEYANGGINPFDIIESNRRKRLAS